ncbi:MAG: HAD-IA family hydrolase [Candidatus Aenigmarchaeota archaeon]|nr:HAD-IA family hydrolase [Candidatus Aenigmarchaeota archaeon]
MKAAIFDLGGVYFKDSVKEIFRMYPISQEDLRDLRYVYDEELLKGKVSASKFWEMMSKATGVSAKVIRDFYFDGLQPIEGVPQLVENLSRRHDLGIISGIDSERLEYLDKKFGFTKPFSVCVFSCDMKTNKPDEIMYRTALDRLGLPGEECVYTDDNPNYLKPAEKLGMKTILFESPEQLKREMKLLGIEVD